MRTDFNIAKPQDLRITPGAETMTSKYDSDYHAPVLADETADLLVNNQDGIYIDATLGGGGHTAAILERLSEKGRVVGVDRDDEALQTARKRHASDRRFEAVKGSFGSLKNLAESLELDAVSGVLFDLGISSHQIDVAERGFSFDRSGALDMRMDQDGHISAHDVVNHYEPEDLSRIIRQYGEEPRARKLVRSIVESRPMETTGELADAIRRVTPFRETGRTLARVFQGIRIEVNQELVQLEEALLAAQGLLATGGRLAVISYHSLEDRRAKRFLKTGNFAGESVKDFYGNDLSPFKLVSRKPILASEEEIERNPRSRSARLRVAEKVEQVVN